MIGHLAIVRVVGAELRQTGRGTVLVGGTPTAECTDCGWVGPGREGYHTASDDARRHMRESREAAAANGNDPDPRA